MGARAASMQFGYFAGSLAGGVALSVGGYAVFGLVVSVVFVAAAGTVAPLPRLFRRTPLCAGALPEPAC
jgi:predicted MFS family arabinose efflux permease